MRIIRKEALSRDFLNCGLAYKNERNDKKAIEKWKLGLLTPNDTANHKWKKLIESQLKNYENDDVF
ncbi:MAG: hypothetical protein ACFFAS_18940 [Promethearchaeota archaeon]